jgi:DNA-3-methyladenine glycosylase II
MTSTLRLPLSTRRPLELRPRPPFRLDLTVWALRRREQNAIDSWDGRRYRRVLRVGGVPLELAVTQVGPVSRPRLELVIEARRTSSAEDVARAVLTRLLGLDVDLSGFYVRAARDPILQDLAARYRGVKPPRFPSVFECLLNAVACQQLSLEAGMTVLSRLAAAADRSAGSLHAFPEPSDVLRIAPGLRDIGFSERKATTILTLARAAVAGDFALEELAPLGDAAVRERLMRQPGIGPWSADYVLLRGLGRLHVFPRHDVGALNGLQRLLSATGRGDDPEEALVRFAPDAGLAYFHLLLRGLEQRGLLDRPASG